jgi:hypothetical protein
MEPRRKLILYIVAAFVLGALGGAFVGNRVIPPRERSERHDGRSPMTEFAQRLKLDQRQTAMVDSILESHRAVFDSIRHLYGKAFRAERDSIRLRIQAILTDEQKGLYDDFIKQMDERASRRRPEGEGPDRRPR